MGAAAPSVAAARSVRSGILKNPSAASRPSDPPPNPSRRPLIPSERGNAAVSGRPHAKEITSRYLSSSSSTTSTSYSSNTTTTTSSSSSSFRRSPSPLPNYRPLTPAVKRSQSVDRTRPSTPHAYLRGGGGPIVSEGSNAVRSLSTTTRCLSVSFQGESFFYQTSKAKIASPVPVRKPSPERRRPSTPARNSIVGIASENSRQPENYHRWPAARSQQSSLLTKGVECSAEGNDLSTVQLLRQSMLFEGGTGRDSFDGAELTVSSETDSFSSGSNSGTHELNLPRQTRVTSRGISVPARFWQETSSRQRQLPEPGTPLSSSVSRNSAVPKMASARRSLVDSPFQYARSVSSPLRGPVRPSSPSKLAGSPSRGMPSPLRARGSSALASYSHAGLPANAPSIIRFAAEVRRSKKGENRIEEAHILRLLHNRHLQWRRANARANAALTVQRVTAEKNLYNAWNITSEVCDSVIIKKMKLHFLRQCLRLMSILKGQMVYLEEFSLVDREHSSSLSGAIVALKASTLRLPFVSGSVADLQEVKDAVGSAVDVMQAMVASLYSILPKVEGPSSLVSELAKVYLREQVLLDRSRDLLPTIHALHVKQCSLRAHLLQLKRKGSQI